MTLASDNKFPKIIVTEGSAPSSPSAGDFKLFVDSSDHLFKMKNSAGTVTTFGQGIADMGTATYLDFTTGSAPSSPASGKVRLYSLTGNHLYQKDSSGTATALDSAGGGGGTTPTILLDYTQATDIGGIGMSAATWTDVVANQNFTVASGSSLVEFALRGVAICNGGSGNYFLVRIQIDSAGTPINKTLGGVFRFATNMNVLDGLGPVYVSGLSAAVHTVKIQAFSRGGDNFFCRAATTDEFLSYQVTEHL